MIDEIVQLIKVGDREGAMRVVQREGSEHEIADRFNDVVMDLYWKARDVPALAVVARGGMEYCLVRMEKSTDPADRDHFGSAAKRLAYNLASFVWPGWDEPGIQLTAADVAMGAEAAELNLRLAKELNKPADRVEDAWWLVGAHRLSASDPAGALAAFRNCSPESRPLFRGYLFLARILLGEMSAQREFDDLIAAMRAKDTQDSKFIESQLTVAHRVFTQDSAKWAESRAPGAGR